MDQLWATATDIYQRKQAFVAAVRQLSISLTGLFGDEGGRIRASIAAMDTDLQRWDEAIARFERAVGQREHDAEAHVALGTVYLDRYRADEALGQFSAAVALDAGRADVFQFMALAYGLAHRPSEAAQVLLKAVALQPSDPIPQYEMAGYRMAAGRAAEARSALQAFQKAVEARVTSNPSPAGGPGPFKRVGLLRQGGGVAPIFPPASYVPAFELLTRGELKEAVAQCRRVAEGDPLLEGAAAGDLLALGSSALRSGDLAAALRYLRAAIEANPGRAEAHRILGTASRLDEQYDQSIEHYRAAMAASPTDERSRMALADVLIAEERYPDAERELKQTIQAIPGTVQAHYKLGRLYQSMAKYPEALQELEQVATYTPLVGQDSLYEILGVIYATQTDYSHAAEAIRKQLSVNPNAADGHRRLAEVYVRQDQLDEALAEFTATLLIDPRSVESHLGMSQVHLRAGQYEEAAREARSALALAPAQKDAQYVLAMSLLRLGQAEEGNRELATYQRLQAEAASMAQRKVEMDGLRREIAVSMAGADYAKAVPLLRQIIAREPAVAAHYVELGDALLKTTQITEAVEAFENALQREPSDPALYLRLAQAYLTAGRPDESRQTANRYRELIDRGKKDRLLRLGNP